MRRSAAALALFLVAGCTVGPDYRRPPVATPAAFKELNGWKVSEPRDLASRGDWWAIYDDPTLDALERQVEVSNQNLAAAEAAFRASRAVVSQARATFFPIVDVNASGQRFGRGGGGSTSRTITTPTGTSVVSTRSGGFTGNEFSLSTTATWDLDVWGRIRRTVEADVASAQASAADLAAARLSAQAALATDYFTLQAADELKRLLDATVVAYTASLRIARNQYAAGIASKADVASAETQLHTAQSQAINVGVQRAQLEHAIAMLIGKPPAELSIAPLPFVAEVPTIPVGVPSTLLERRPDIAAAERRMAAFNADIGVAEAAFYPDITLSASYGFASSAVDTLLQASNYLWSLGANLALTVFDAGERSAVVEQARANYDQGVAAYRQTVLTGFQQVEDQLAALRILAEQAEVQDLALRSAREAERLTLNQYKAGTIPFTNVVVAQTAALANAETALTIRQNRLIASVALIQALGGGWSDAQLPSREAIEDPPPQASEAQTTGRGGARSP